MIADIGNAVSFLNRVKALKIRGQKGYVGTSNIVWNSVEYSIAFCKNLMALWVSPEILLAIFQKFIHFSN